MDFFTQAGKMAIGSRLRRLSERLTDDAAQVFKLYNLDFHPKWFPVFYTLWQEQEKTITEIAEHIGHTHPSVSKIVRELLKKGYVSERKDANDGRRNVVCLSEKGRALLPALELQFNDVREVVEDIASQTRNDLWEAIKEWEFLLEYKSLARRVQEHQKQRESQHVKIIDYTPAYKTFFRTVNEEWISKYFTMEEADYKALDHPQEYILDRGGCIVVALYKDEPVGVCALIKMDDPDYDFELAKMGVSPKAQGKNIGWLLGQAMIEKARLLGAKKIYLESNTILKPAINLYHKLGFKKVAGRPTPYARCNIQMELAV